MIGEKGWSLVADSWPSVRHFISQALYSFCNGFFCAIAIHFKANIAANKIYFYIFQAFFIQVFCYRQCTVGTVHPLYFPFYFFHAAKLFYAFIALLLLKENIFATWS